MSPFFQIRYFLIRCYLLFFVVRTQDKIFEDGIYKIEEHSEHDEFMEDSFCYQTELELPKNEVSRSISFERSNDIHVVAEVHSYDDNTVQVPVVPQNETVFKISVKKYTQP